MINKIHHGDCLELSKRVPDDFIDLVITSPPYADTTFYGSRVDIFSPKEYVDWMLRLSSEIGRFLKKRGSFILNINDRISNGERSTFVFELIYKIVDQTNLKLFDRYIWFKKSTLPVGGTKRLNDRIEYIFHFVKNVKDFKVRMDRVRVPYKEVSLRRFQSKVHGNDVVLQDGTTELSQRGSSKAHPIGSKPITVFRFDTCSALRGIKHPAPYHPQIPEWFINWLTDEEDVILDPFLGSGTTAEVAYRMGRKFIGFEINEKYVEMAEERLKMLIPDS